MRGMRAACLALAIGACESSKSEPDSVLDDPVAKRLAPAITPYRAYVGEVRDPEDARHARYLAGEYLVGRSMYAHDDETKGAIYEKGGQLTAVVALPDRVAFIAPATGRVGFDLHQGGLDLPWRNSPLNDLDPKQVGALDAVAAGPDELVAVFRGRNNPSTVTMYRVRTDGAVTQEVIPRPTPMREDWWNDRCPDVAVGVRKDKTVDVVFAHRDDNFHVLHATRAQGAPAWQVNPIDWTNAPWRSVSPPGTNSEIGCRNVIAYGENDNPQVLSLSRNLVMEKNGVDYSPNLTKSSNTVRGYVLGAEGKWVLGPLGLGPIDVSAKQWMPNFDIEAHPAGGFLFAASEVQYGFPQVNLPIAPGMGESLLEGRKYTSDWDRDSLFLAINGGKILTDDCGIIQLGVHEGVLAQTLHQYIFGQANACQTPRHAPIFRAPEHKRVLEQAGVFAHGHRPYDVGICVTEKGEYSVCWGAHDWAHWTAGPLPSIDGAPTLVSSNPPHGATDVAATTNEVTIELGRAPKSGERVLVEVVDVLISERLELAGEPEQVAPGRFRIKLGRALLPGHTYRAALTYTAFTYARNDMPVASFRVAKAP